MDNFLLTCELCDQTGFVLTAAIKHPQCVVALFKIQVEELDLDVDAHLSANKPVAVQIRGVGEGEVGGGDGRTTQWRIFLPT